MFQTSGIYGGVGEDRRIPPDRDLVQLQLTLSGELNHALTGGQARTVIVGQDIDKRGATMDADTFFLDCPAYIDRNGTVRCGLPAAAEDRYTLGSTDGAVTGVRIRCPAGHWFSGPVDALTIHAAAVPDVAADAPRASIPG